MKLVTHSEYDELCTAMLASTFLFFFSFTLRIKTIHHTNADFRIKSIQIALFGMSSPIGYSLPSSFTSLPSWQSPQPLFSDFLIPSNELKITAFLSEGGTGRVYRGLWTPRSWRGNATAKVVALKWIRGEAASAQCNRELSALSNVNHPNIVELHGYSLGVSTAFLPLFSDSGTEPTGFFLVMELSPQGSVTTMSRTLQRLRHLDPASHMKLMLSYSVQIASGLQHLHSKRMLHLDLKPDNILCFVENRVKLCDFGTSKNLTRTNLTDTVASGRCTVQYAAPEVLIEEDMECDGRVLPAPKSPNTVSVATDLYSLGSVLCELFSGKAPWGDRNHFSICAAISRGASPNILQHPWPSNCPQEIVNLIIRLLSFNPDERGTLESALIILTDCFSALANDDDVRSIPTVKSPIKSFAKDPNPSEVFTGSQNLSLTAATVTTLGSPADSQVSRGDETNSSFGPNRASLSSSETSHPEPLILFPPLVEALPLYPDESEPHSPGKRRRSGEAESAEPSLTRFPPTQHSRQQQQQRHTDPAKLQQQQDADRQHQQQQSGQQLPPVAPLPRESLFDEEEHGRLNTYGSCRYTPSCETMDQCEGESSLLERDMNTQSSKKRHF